MIQISPYIGADQLKFGSDITSCINFLGNNFKIKPKSLPTIDEYVFEEKGIMLSFNDKKLEYIGFLKNSHLQFQGEFLFQMNLGKIRSFLNCNGDCLEDGVSLVSKRMGIGFFFSNKSESSFPDEISLFTKGYYEEFEDEFKIV